MADTTTEGTTDNPTKTVEPQNNLDQSGLADLLKSTLDREEQPEPQPAVAEEQSEESESSEDAAVGAAEETDTDLSQTETPEAEAEQAAEEGDGDEDGLTADVQASVDKRIGKEVRKRKEALEAKKSAEAEAAELKQKLEEAEMRAREAGEVAADFVPPATEANPFASLNNLNDVQKEMLRAEQTMEWAEDNPDGALLQTEEGEREFTSEDVREIKKKASRALRRQLPEQQAYLQARDTLEPKALETYPWWKDKASSEFQSAMQLLRQMPELARFPDYKFVVGDYLAGRGLRENPSVKQGAAKVAKKAPSQPTAPTAEPAPVDPAAARSASAKKAFQETGGVDELANLLKTGEL